MGTLLHSDRTWEEDLSEHKSSSQRCHNCFSSAKFAFTFSQLMKLNQDILLTISIAVDLNVSSSWISSFSLSKHPGEGVHSTKWLTEFYYKGLSGLCLQLSRFNMVLGFDLCQDNTVVTKTCKERGTAPHSDRCYNFICMLSLLTPIQYSLQALCLVIVFWIAFRPSIKCFTTDLFMWIFIFTFDICSGCESQNNCCPGG